MRYYVNMLEEGHIQMNKVAHNNLWVKLGVLVNIHQCLDIKYGKCVHILPFDDSIEGLSIFFWRYMIFMFTCYNPDKSITDSLLAGDTFLVCGGMWTVDFKLIETDPSEFCIVAQDTIIHTSAYSVLNLFYLSQLFFSRGWSY